MSILKGKINPLNVLGLRITSGILPHFKTIALPHLDQNKKDKINRWIYLNLNGRYCIKDQVNIDDEVHRFSHRCIAGFEDPRDLTIFLLSCNLINGD